MIEITPAELKNAMDAGKDFLIVDTRGENDVLYAHLAPYINIPLDALVGRASELPKDKDVILICHKGDLSLNACCLMQAYGFENVRSLKGGIDAWSKTIDPSIPRY